jgi:hypothetical protein
MRVITLLVFVAAAALAQTRPTPPGPNAPVNEKLLWTWNSAATKLNEMAADFPEDKYDYRPSPQVRTFAEQLLHVAFWNQFVEKTARGEKADGSADQLDRSQYKTKADVVRVLRESFEQATAALKAQTNDQALRYLRLWTEFAEHTGEHYGQLVVYYRLNGLVPPASRQR